RPPFAPPPLNPDSHPRPWRGFFRVTSRPHQRWIHASCCSKSARIRPSSSLARLSGTPGGRLSRYRTLCSRSSFPSGVTHPPSTPLIRVKPPACRAIHSSNSACCCVLASPPGSCSGTTKSSRCGFWAHAPSNIAITKTPQILETNLILQLPGEMRARFPVAQPASPANLRTNTTRSQLMATLKPFPAVRPTPESARAICAPPYDVVNTEEARAAAEGNPLSFFRVSRPEIELAPDADPYSDQVYAHGASNLAKL